MTYDGMIKRTSLETRPSVLIVYHADTNQKLANDVIVNCTRNRLMLIEY